MGSFSWLLADTRTKRSNIMPGEWYRILIPKEFGGGYIEDCYGDFGRVFADTPEEADLYGILAYWNGCEDMDYDGDEYPKTMKDILERGKTSLDNNREKGIEIGCYDEDIDKLKYPLKLVSTQYTGSYETCHGRSYGDPAQGFVPTWRGDTKEDIGNRMEERYLWL